MKRKFLWLCVWVVLPCAVLRAQSALQAAAADDAADTTGGPIGNVYDVLYSGTLRSVVLARSGALGVGGPSSEVSRLRVIRMLSHAGYSLSAILRMLIQLDQGETKDLRRALDTPLPDEDVYLASDRWISTLADQERRAHTIIALIDEMIQKQARQDR